ncbi:ROK family protein [Pedobacter agri]|uniref:ROK family protein n=1 Tax=Pedobacter agri TaxID=454586 RepID=UPI002931E4DD|nr:ROK family protein [Pedobacter agri]
MNQLNAIGIDVGGSSIKCGVVDPRGEILYSTNISLKNVKTHGAVIGHMTEAINDCTKRYADSILGVGVGFPGIIENNIVIAGGINLPGFKNVELGNILKLITRKNIIIDNDANLMGLGELTYGAAKNCSDAVFLTVGTGIGGAVLIDGKLYGGFKNRGTELGHMIINHKGKACACGARGCLEAYASITAMVNHYQSICIDAPEHVDARYIVNRYMLRESEAIEVMESHFEYMATGIVSLINLFNPQRVIIGGGISESGSFYIREIEKRVLALAVPTGPGYSQIVAAGLGNRAGLLGCAANIFQRYGAIEPVKQTMIV